MKKSLLMLSLCLTGSALFGANVAIEIDGRAPKTTFTEIKGLSFIYNQKEKDGSPNKTYFEFRDTKEVPLTWTQYEVSFIPSKDCYVTLGLSATGPTKKGMVDWIEYDKIEVTNGSLKNPSFEQKSTSNEFYGWRYYSKESEKIGQDDAADGKNYIAGAGALPPRQGMAVKGGQVVTVKFMARSAGFTPAPADLGKFFSDQNAPQAK